MIISKFDFNRLDYCINFVFFFLRILTLKIVYVRLFSNVLATTNSFWKRTTKKCKKTICPSNILVIKSKTDTILDAKIKWGFNKPQGIKKEILLNLFILLLLPKNKIIKTAKNGNLVKNTIASIGQQKPTLAKRNRNKKINWKVENNKKATEKKLKELAFIGKKLLTIVAKNIKIIKKVKKAAFTIQLVAESIWKQKHQK